jgi:hypothetical protein
VVATSLRETLIKIGAKVVSYGRYVTFEMAEVAVPRQMFQEILSLIARLRATDGRKRRKRCAPMRAEQRLSAPRRSRPAAFDRLLRTRCAIYRCRNAPKGRSRQPNRPESGECRFHLEDTGLLALNAGVEALVRDANFGQIGMKMAVIWGMSDYGVAWETSLCEGSSFPKQPALTRDILGRKQ